MSTFPPSSDAVRRALTPFVDDGSLAGAVALVADSSSVRSVDTVGWSDLAAEKPIQPDSMFWIASQTKPFVSTCIMMLVEEGCLSLEDPVQRFIPEFAQQWLIVQQAEDKLLLKRPSRATTVADLLTHGSGLPFTSAMERPTLDGISSRDRVLSYAMTHLLYEPGARYNYSNAGVETAGRIVELVSGQEYPTFLRERLLDPLGMTDTTFWPTSDQVRRLAKTYKPNELSNELEETTTQFLRYPLDDRKRTAMAAGGLFSTASDVVKFCRMYLNNGALDGVRYLSEDSIRELTHGRKMENLDVEMGLCWYVDATSYSHGGALSTNMSVYPDADRALVFLVQHIGFPNNGAEALGAFKKAALGLDNS